MKTTLHLQTLFSGKMNKHTWILHKKQYMKLRTIPARIQYKSRQFRKPHPWYQARSFLLQV